VFERGLFGLAASEHSIPHQKRMENDFSPQADIQWHSNSTTYATYSVRRGFNGGGFDFQLDSPKTIQTETVTMTSNTKMRKLSPPNSARS
jgi:hypothetical protein